MLLKNISLFLKLRNICKRTEAILFISFFQAGIRVPIVLNISDTFISIFSHHHFFSFLSFFMNNFCIALCLLSATKLWEIATRTWSIYLVDGKPNKHVFGFTPSVGVEHFWVDLDGRHISTLTPSVGVVHMWVVYTWSWF